MTDIIFALIALIIGAWIGSSIAYDAGRNDVLQEQCEEAGRTWAMVAGDPQCLDVQHD